MRKYTIASAAAVAVAIGAFAGVGAQRPSDLRTFTVHEGTSMAIAVSPDKTRIALDLQGGLWVMPMGGGAARRVTDEYGDIRQPSWSPDGKTIAFQSYRDGQWRIWTIAPDGSGAAAITSGSFDDREPHWSPDGTKIAFSSDRSGNYDIWVLDVATKQIRQLTTDAANDFFPTFSPDSRTIAFVSNRASAPGVYTITLDGAEKLAAAAAGNVGSPSWSPDGKVLFTTVQGTSSRLVFDGTEIASGEDYFPFRAQWVSAEEFVYPADGKIKRRSLKTGELASIAFSAELSVRKADYPRKPRDYDATAPNIAKGIVRPVVSPDGKEIAFAALGDLWRMPIGGQPVRLTDDVFVDTDPAWSPDGTRIAFSTDRAGSMDVWVRDLKSGTDRRLTTGSDADMAAAWSPDGKSILYVSNISFEQGEVYVVPADGGTAKRLTDRLFGVAYPSWTADGKAIVTPAFKPYSTRYREGMNYYNVIPVAGGDPQLVIPTEHVPMGKRSSDGPALSPDGKLLAYVSDELLYVLPVGPDAKPTGPARRLTSELADQISWASPTQILYTATDRLKLLSVTDGSTMDIPVDLTWTRRVPSGRLVVHAGRLIDGVQQTARVDVDVIIEKNRIVAIEPHSASLHTGTVVDATGQSVMPGLFEGHGHQLKEHGILFGRVHLAYGITSFRNLSSAPYEGLEDKEAIESGRRAGPRIFSGGYLIDGKRPYYPMASTMPSAQTIDMELERAKRLDYDILKTYVRLPDDLQKRAIEGAHRIGIPTSSHEIYPAGLSGTDNVEHTGATSRRGYSTKQSVMGKAYEDVIQIIAQSGMVITPTLALGGFNTATSADPSLQSDPRFRTLQPAWVQPGADSGSSGRGGRGGGRDGGGTGRPEGWNTVMKLQKAGVPVQAGVDSPLTAYATSLHVELQDFVSAGMTPYEALRSATTIPAMAIGVGADLGSIEKGKLADMVIVDGNPLVNIKDTMRVRKVIKNGELFTIEQLLDVPGGAPNRTASSSSATLPPHAD